MDPITHTIYGIRRPDGSYVVGRLPQSSTVPALFATEKAASSYRSTALPSEVGLSIATLSLVPTRDLVALAESHRELHRRAQKAESLAEQMKKERPTGWAQVFFKEYIRRKEKRELQEARDRASHGVSSYQPEIREVYLALAYAVRALHNLAGDRFLAARMDTPSSATYLRIARDEMQSPGSRYNRIMNKRGSTITTGCKALVKLETPSPTTTPT